MLLKCFRMLILTVKYPFLTINESRWKNSCPIMLTLLSLVSRIANLQSVVVISATDNCYGNEENWCHWINNHVIHYIVTLIISRVIVKTNFSQIFSALLSLELLRLVHNIGNPGCLTEWLRIPTLKPWSTFIITNNPMSYPGLGLTRNTAIKVYLLSLIFLLLPCTLMLVTEISSLLIQSWTQRKIMHHSYSL